MNVRCRAAMQDLNVDLLKDKDFEGNGYKGQGYGKRMDFSCS